MRQNKKYNKMFLYAIGIVAISCVFLAVLLHFSYVKGLLFGIFAALKPVAYALIFVFCVSGIVNALSSFFGKRIKGGVHSETIVKTLSVVFGYLFFLLIIAALLVIVVLPLVNSYSDILIRIPEYLSGARAWVSDAISSVPILSGQSERIMDYISESLNFSYDSIQKYVPVVMSAVNALLSETSSILVGFIISIYIVCSGRYISRVRDRLVGAFLSRDRAQRTHEALVKIYGFFNDFFSSRLLYSLVIGIVFYIVLWIMDVPLYSFVSIMIGVLVFVPVVGTMLAFALSTFFVFITSYRLVLWFVCVFIVVMLIGYFVFGRYIIRSSVKTTVTASLISVLIFSGLFGTIGAVLAIPVYLSCKLVFSSMLESIERKRARIDSEAEEFGEEEASDD